MDILPDNLKVIEGMRAYCEGFAEKYPNKGTYEDGSMFVINGDTEELLMKYKDNAELYFTLCAIADKGESKMKITKWLLTNFPNSNVMKILFANIISNLDGLLEVFDRANEVDVTPVVHFELFYVKDYDPIPMKANVRVTDHGETYLKIAKKTEAPAIILSNLQPGPISVVDLYAKVLDQTSTYDVNNKAYIYQILVDFRRCISKMVDIGMLAVVE